jgi:hypothetical protein
MSNAECVTDTWVDEAFALRREYAAFLKRLDEFSDKTRTIHVASSAKLQ